MARQGFEWLLFDLEHGPLTIETLQLLMQAMNGTETAALVRVPVDESSLVGRVLDCGADGIVFPMVNNRADAERAVRSCLYPPQGIRGMAPRRCCWYGEDFDDYVKTANEQILA